MVEVPLEQLRMDDVMGAHTPLLLVGINPGRRSAELNRHFAGPGNRFWPALRASGLVPEELGPETQHRLVDHGIGITNVVPRPTARAAEVTAAELRAGRARLQALLAHPEDGPDQTAGVIAILGVTAYRTAFGQPAVRRGPQPDHPRLHVLDNPSGLNAHAQVGVLAAQLAAAGADAGLPV